MKKYWPIGLFVLGLVILGLVYFFVIRTKGDKSTVLEDEVVAEIPFEKRPVVSLTPTEDGHYLKLKIDSLVVEAESLDYELLYQTKAGITQGVPGIIKMKGQKSAETDLLLGSESSGKFRYDEGVEEGTLTLRFRDSKGKLIGKLMTDFHMQTKASELNSLDGKLTMSLSGKQNDFVIVMETFGAYEKLPGKLLAGPYGVFSSGDKMEGEVKLEGVVYVWNNGWKKAEGSVMGEIFVGVASEEK